MNYRILGNSGLKVSEVSFGCMSLDGSHRENAALIKSGIDAGINFFDTADLYDRGENEVTLGKALRSVRNAVVIATKVGNKWREDGSGWDWNARRSYIIEAVEKSLARLQTDYIDLYQLHGGTLDDPVDEVIGAFELLKEQGKIRAYGISSIRPNVIREYAAKSNLSSVMMQYSLLDRRPEESCLDLLFENGIAVLARGSLAKGLLAGKPAEAYLKLTAEAVYRSSQVVSGLSQSGRSPAQTAIQWVLKNPAVTAAVCGIRTTAQLKDILGFFAAPQITVHEKQVLDRCVTMDRYENHR